MKRWISHLVIAVYLGALGYGLFAHALRFKQSVHPVMYYLVWDMFCGYDAYAMRFHVIGEGESGRYYELAPGPWPSHKPYNEMERHHYDVGLGALPRIALNTLKNTTHEPITRMFVVEESWSKKFNLPDPIWDRRYGTPKDKVTYHRMRQILTGDGIPIHSYPSWYSQLANIALLNNPRLRADSVRSRPFYAVSPSSAKRSGFTTDPHETFRTSPVGSNLGN